MVSEREKEELTGVVAAIARSTIESSRRPSSDQREWANLRPLFHDREEEDAAVSRIEVPPSDRGFGRGILSLEAHQSVVGRGRASSRGREPRDYVE
jgi:hypothetical protein